MPNLARDAADIRKNAAAVSAILEKRGVKTRLLEVAGAPPVVYGEIAGPGRDPHHHLLRALRRPAARSQGVGDAAVAAHAARPRRSRRTAVPFRCPPPARSIPSGASTPARPATTRRRSSPSPPRSTRLKAAAIPLRSNLKFVFEGEEEAGSPHLAQIIAANKDLLRSDVWLICDGPVHQSRRQQIVFGARGIVTIDITLYGPNHELHSGHYGNWAPNPAMALARLLASMKDDDGRVTDRAFLRRHRAAHARPKSAPSPRRPTSMPTCGASCGWAAPKAAARSSSSC